MINGTGTLRLTAASALTSAYIDGEVTQVAIAKEQDGAAAPTAASAVIAGNVRRGTAICSDPEARISRCSNLKAIPLYSSRPEDDDTSAVAALTTLVVILMATPASATQESPHG